MKKNKNETGRSVHRSIRTLEEAVEMHIADLEGQLEAQRKAEERKDVRGSWRSIKNVWEPLRKLRAAFEAHAGRPAEVPRKEYERKTTVGADRNNEIEERHESFGLVNISRIQGYSKLWGSSVRHQHYFRLQILRGKRVVTGTMEHFWDDGRVPVVEVSLSAAQFVEMITSQNIGSGVPCTINYVEGVPMDEVPEGAGSELKVMVEMFEDRMVEAVDAVRKTDDEISELLSKKSFTIADKDAIKAAIHKARRLIDDSAPYILKTFGEHTEKMVAKGKTEIESFIQLAVQKAGIKAIKDSGGTLLLGAGDEDSTD
jgi:hypothetical protein